MKTVLFTQQHLLLLVLLLLPKLKQKKKTDMTLFKSDTEHIKFQDEQNLKLDIRKILEYLHHLRNFEMLKIRNLNEETLLPQKHFLRATLSMFQEYQKEK